MAADRDTPSRTRAGGPGLVRLALVATGLWITAAGQARATDPGDACRMIADDRARLACYDQAHRREVTPAPATAQGSPDAARDIVLPDASHVEAPADAPLAAAPQVEEAAVAPATRAADTHKGVQATSAATADAPSLLAEVWELDAAHRRGTFHLVPHRPNYFLLGRYSSDRNTLPSSPAPGHQPDAPLQVDATEAKFQFSVKVKALEAIFGDNGDLWFAYSQQSHWQVYDFAGSSPFRETDYEPEAILSFHTDATVLGWRWRLLNLGFVHQSNGRPLPLSRSWNRVYAQFGLERGRFTLLARPWLRLPEGGADDDNPDIGDYLGRGDVRLAYARGGHVLSALGRYSFSGKRGALQLEWAFPLSGALKGYLQAISGYGESLIDYNHAQNTIGVGILLVPW